MRPRRLRYGGIGEEIAGQEVVGGQARARRWCRLSLRPCRRRGGQRAKESARLFRSRLLSRRMAGRGGGGEQSRADGERQGGGARAGAGRRSGVRAHGGDRCGLQPEAVGDSEARRERARAAVGASFFAPAPRCSLTGPSAGGQVPSKPGS